MKNIKNLKDWGYEILIEDNDLYCIRLLHFKSGHKLPMHYHLNKDKTWYVNQGSFIYRYIDLDTNKLKQMSIGYSDSIRILPSQIHQLTSITDGIILEVSTKSIDDDIYYHSDINTGTRGHIYHTLNDRLIDLRLFNYNDTQLSVESKYGWEAAMYWSNIVNSELEKFFTINEGDVFVDLGSNIGMSATYAELKGASKIYCVEPDPNIFKCLDKNKGDNWILYNGAISNYNGEINIGLWPLNNEQVLANCKTFDKFVLDNNISKIDYLKVDIEGAELDVIRSISTQTWSIIDKAFIEYHESVYNFSENTRNELINILVSNGICNYHICLGNQSLIYFWR